MMNFWLLNVIKVFVWLDVEVVVMGVKVVVGILYKKKLVVVLEYECEVLYD